MYVCLRCRSNYWHEMQIDRVGGDKGLLVHDAAHCKFELSQCIIFNSGRGCRKLQQTYILQSHVTKAWAGFKYRYFYNISHLLVFIIATDCKCYDDSTRERMYPRVFCSQMSHSKAFTGSRQIYFRYSIGQTMVDIRPTDERDSVIHETTGSHTTPKHAFPDLPLSYSAAPSSALPCEGEVFDILAGGSAVAVVSDGSFRFLLSPVTVLVGAA